MLPPHPPSTFPELQFRFFDPVSSTFSQSTPQICQPPLAPHHVPLFNVPSTSHVWPVHNRASGSDFLSYDAGSSPSDLQVVFYDPTSPTVCPSHQPSRSSFSPSNTLLLIFSPQFIRQLRFLPFSLRRILILALLAWNYRRRSLSHGDVFEILSPPCLLAGCVTLAPSVPQNTGSTNVRRVPAHLPSFPDAAIMAGQFWSFSPTLPTFSRRFSLEMMSAPSISVLTSVSTTQRSLSLHSRRIHDMETSTHMAVVPGFGKRGT